jgi:substrate import-associated zinc metallohydrolase lipoprotein
MKCFIKNITLFFIAAALGLLLLTSCNKNNDNLNIDIVGLGGDTWPKDSIGRWLRDTLTKPYNIDVKYRWDAFELDLDKTLVPPSLDKIVPMMRVVKYGWIDSYEEEAGGDFIRLFCPKQYELVGSVAYNTNGTVTLGEAEAGRKVILYRVNQLNIKDTAFVKRVLKTIQHEFGHILHQNILYSAEYPTITPGYTTTWNTVSDVNARAAGFITPYAMSGPDEDFVEMISVMLTEGKANYDAIVNAQAATPKAALRSKELIVVNYFKQNYNIDFYSLQTRCRAKLAAITK